MKQDWKQIEFIHIYLHGFFFNSSLLWDVFIINSVEQLQTLPKTQSVIDISPFLKAQIPSIIEKNYKKREGVHKLGTYGWSGIRELLF